VCGSWCNEISWQLLSGGVTQCSGSSGAPVESDCCPEAIYDYTLQMQDSYGDGWNGGQLTIGDVTYTIEEGSSKTVEIYATEEAPPSNTAYTVSSTASVTIGDNDDADEAAEVTAIAFANSCGMSTDYMTYMMMTNGGGRRLLGMSIEVQVTITVESESTANDIADTVSDPGFSDNMASEMANVAEDMGVTVTVESLETSEPEQGTVVTGCPSLSKKECKADDTCSYDKSTDTCSDLVDGCPAHTKKGSCKSAGCTWTGSVCEDKLPGCAGHDNKKDCRADDACQYDKYEDVCKPQLDGCAGNTSKSKCWKYSDLVCAWDEETSKCVDGVCSGKGKKECKQSPLCTYGKRDGDSSKTCYDTEE